MLQFWRLRDESGSIRNTADSGSSPHLGKPLVHRPFLMALYIDYVCIPSYLQLTEINLHDAKQSQYTSTCIPGH